MIPATLIPLPIDREIARRVERIEIPFNRYGIDPYGVDKRELARLYTMLGFFYHRYFRVTSYDVDNVPESGRAMLVGNHSGGWAVDAIMTIASMFFAREPPRLAQGMAEYFLNRIPFASWFTNRIGQFTGLPEHAIRLLEDDRLLLVFPEGARGTAKLYPDRDSLVPFGTGFIRLALQTRSPVVPFAFIGGGEAIPTVTNLYRVGRFFGMPYVPITPYLFAVPLPVSLQIVYGEPIMFEGDGTEPDEIVRGYVSEVTTRISELIRRGRALRRGDVPPAELQAP